MPWIRRHPLSAFFVITYALSWAYWIPLALSGARVAPGPHVSHFPGLLGPALSAFIVTFLTEGRAGVISLARRLVLVSRPQWQFALYSASPLIFLVLAIAVARITGAVTPPASDFGVYSGLPALGLPVVALLVLLFNGFGEETGWRGFALEKLQRRHGMLRGTLILATLWAGWHTPAFFFVETYRQLSIPAIVFGFGLGICAGALVLSRIAAATGGSVLAAALWHAAYNMTSATAGSRGVIAAVTTACVMAWAALLLIQHWRSR